MSQIIERWIYAALSQDASIADVVGGKIYPVRAPRMAGLPYILFGLANNETRYTLGGSVIPDEENFYISSYATDTQQALDLNNLVKELLLTKIAGTNQLNMAGGGTVSVGPVAVEDTGYASQEPIDGSDLFLSVVTLTGRVFEGDLVEA